MRKLLLFFAMLFVSIGTWAAEFTWTSDDGNYTITASDMAPVGNDTYQRLEVSGPGALEAFINATKDLSDSEGGPLKGVGGNETRVHLRIDGDLNAADLAALNSSEVYCLGTFTSLDLQAATIPSLDAVKSMNLGNMEHLLLPCGFQEDATAFESLKSSTNNANLKLVASTDAATNADEIAIYSFEANNVFNALGYKGTLQHQTGDDSYTSVPVLLNTVNKVKMAGEFGDKDLYQNDNKVFAGNPGPGVWDFTGATFTPYTISSFSFADGAKHYPVDNAFLDPDNGFNSLTNHESNAFYFFSYYAQGVVDIKLPTGIDTLPPGSLGYLGKSNKAAYQKTYGLTDDQFAAQFGTTDQNGNPTVPQAVTLETLTIPDNYRILDYECGVRPNVTHIVVGNGVKEVRGGAFVNSTTLSDLDFASSIRDLWIGDFAFGESSSMKHIALSEGIVSVGASAFKNSQHLESIRLPQTLINIGNNAFDNCLALNSITIPENVEKIGKQAFNLCPFTDIFLTTTDPEKIPIVWSAGTGMSAGESSFDGNCTFNHGHIDGWEGGVDQYRDQIDNNMSWEEAAAFYYVNWNGMPVLHFPSQLAEKVRSSISSEYALKTKADEDGKQYGLPMRVDIDRRGNIPGADLGSPGQGKYTKDGWAQFMLMKETVAGPGSEIYTKEYDDVWYTMCFPFDLTDEQLAGAFNETFNIVDFSGVEIKEADEEAGTPKKLVLHFNNVAITHYKDTEGNLYSRKTDTDGNTIREQHGNFSYNVYLDKNGTEYHHAIVSSDLRQNKTKTFAPGSAPLDLSGEGANLEDVVIIDGILASAGHPYMIHPAIGFNDGGNNKKKCNFSGITWKPMTQWPSIFEAEQRTVDLGVAKGNQSTGEPDEDNFFQAAYSDYAGQTYTFIGNATEYRADAQGAIGNEPQVPEKPNEPVAPTEPTETLTEPTETIDEPTALTADEQTLFGKLSSSIWTSETEITSSYNDGSSQWNSYNNNCWNINNESYLKEKFGENYLYGANAAEVFNYCKEVFNKGKNYDVLYAAYLANQAEWNAYNANQAAWNAYNTYDPVAAQAAYQTALAEYNTAAAAHDTWVEGAKKWLTYIPKNAYFLGRKTGDLPKYYREVAENPAPGVASTRKGGIWSQFTAIVIPNDAAVAGIESELDGKTASSKGFDMAFDESFLGNVIEQDDVVTLIEKAQEDGAKVEYMDIVVSINGQVVRRGTTSLEGLPRGMYIINGKKYFVK